MALTRQRKSRRARRGRAPGAVTPQQLGLALGADVELVLRRGGGPAAFGARSGIAAPLRDPAFWVAAALASGGITMLLAVVARG